MIPFVDLKPQYAALKTDINEAIQKVLDHGQFILGPEVQHFEKELFEYTGGAHSLCVASGTDALMIAMMAIDIQPGDEIITTSFSFFATAEIIAVLGAKPIFVDIEKDTYNLDANKIEQAVTSKTKAIIPVSLYGQCANMDEINTIAQKHNLTVIEDAAQSFGAKYKGKKSCNVSTLACTSFFPAKPLGCYGDGGAVFSQDKDLADKMESIRTHGQEGRYNHVRLGINGRMDSIQCAVLTQKLKRYDWEIEQRQKVAGMYTEGLKELEGKIQLPVVRDDRDSVWAQYTIAVDNRDQFQAQLKEKGIPTSVHYPVPMHMQPALKKLVDVRFDLSISEQAGKRVVSLPMYADMPDGDVQKVIEAVKSCW